LERLNKESEEQQRQAKIQASEHKRLQGKLNEKSQQVKDLSSQLDESDR
jgi:hypothetical protein